MERRAGYGGEAEWIVHAYQVSWKSLRTKANIVQRGSRLKEKKEESSDSEEKSLVKAQCDNRTYSL